MNKKIKNSAGTWVMFLLVTFLAVTPTMEVQANDTTTPNLPTTTVDNVTYYQISSQTDWDTFAQAVNAGTNSINGILTADIDLGTDQTMIGTSGKAYAGIFDGNGYTLTVAYKGSAESIAPFAYVDGSTIKNLCVAGSVKSSANFVSALVGNAGTSALTISNCKVTADISGTYCGGFVGNANTSTTTITNCLFLGAMSSTNYSSCFVGWEHNSGKLTFNSCLSIPSSIPTVSSSDFACLGANVSATVNNCYCYGNLSDIKERQ